MIKLKKLLFFCLCLISILNLTTITTVAKSTYDKDMLIETEYTLDELYQMTMEEYYRNIFPEKYNEFSQDEIEYLKTFTYENLKDGDVPQRKKNFLLYTTGDLWSSGNLLLSYVVESWTEDKLILNDISHEITLVDVSGRVWIASNNSDKFVDSLISSGTKGGPPGQYKLQVTTRASKIGYNDGYSYIESKWVNN